MTLKRTRTEDLVPVSIKGRQLRGLAEADPAARSSQPSPSPRPPRRSFGFSGWPQVYSSSTD